MPCSITCFFAAVIVISMILMTYMVSNDPVILSYKNQLPDDIKKTYEEIATERATIYYTGYLLGIVISVIIIFYNTVVLKQRMPVSAMVCMTVVFSTLVNYFYYILTPKTKYMLSVIKTEPQKQAWMQMYRSMQYYYHLSFALGIVGVGIGTYAFRGSCE